MELPNLICPYPGRLQKTNEILTKYEVRYDRIKTGGHD